MSAVYIENCKTVEELVNWKTRMEGYLNSIAYCEFQLISAMGMTKGNTVTPADVQFRFDAHMKKLGETK